MKKMHELGGAHACFQKKTMEVHLAPKHSEFARKGIIPQEIIKKVLSGTLAVADIPNAVKEEMDALPYKNSVQKQGDTKEMIRLIERYLTWESRTPSRYSVQKVEMHGEDVSVNPTLCFIEGNTITMTVIKTGKPTISSRGRTPDTYTKKNLLIYSLILAAKKEAESRGIDPCICVGEIVFLKSKDDTEGCPEDFEAKKQVVKERIEFKGGKPKNDGDLATEVSFRGSLNEFLKGRECTKTACAECEMHDKCFYKQTPKAVKKEHRKLELSSYALSDVQKEIAMFHSGVARVNAGAGAGKTLVTALNVVDMVANGVNPESILLITFTNAATEEMRFRVNALLEDYGLEDEANKVKVITFNSFGMELIEKYHSELGYDNIPMLLDSIDQVDILYDVLEIAKGEGLVVEKLHYNHILMDMKNYKGAIPQLKEIFSTIKGHRIDYWRGLAEWYPWRNDELKAIWRMYEIYEAKLLARNLIEYADQENRIFDIASVVPTLYEDMGYAHIIVDEFQDSNIKQLWLLQELVNTACFRSLMVVGDDLQAIYGFRGGEVGNIINFPDLIGKPVKDFFLVDNYRSTQSIINLANKVTGAIQEKVDKTLVSKGVKGEVTPVLGFNTTEEETEFIASQIFLAINEGVPKENICFIARNRSELIAMQDALTRRGVYAIPSTPVKLLDNSKVKAMIGLVEYLYDNSATAGLFHYLNALSDNTMPTDKYGVAILERNRKALDMWLLMDDDAKKEYLLRCVEALKDGDVVYNTFAQSVKERESRHVSEIMSYIEKYKLYDSSEEHKVEGLQKAVNLTTYHTSKGLEWDEVFMSLSSLDSTQGFSSDEERDEILRLIFVGITRAKSNLTITSVETVGGKSVSKRRHWFYHLLRELITNSAA